MSAQEWTTVTSPPASTVTASLGPLLTGMMIGLFLLGIVCSQSITYFRYYFSHDGTFIRLIVAFLFVLVVFLGIMDFVSIYQSIIIGYGDFDKFDRQNWASWAEPAVTALVSSIAHAFYIHRCWAVTHSLVVIISLSLVALLAFASGITISVYCFMLGRMSKLAGAVIPSNIWLLSASVCDISIAIILLSRFWSGGVLRGSSAMLSRLRRITVEAGLLTAICDILNLVLFATFAPASYYLLAQYSISHLYALSVLYTLLGRQDLRELLSNGTDTLVTGFCNNSWPLSSAQISNDPEASVRHSVPNIPAGEGAGNRSASGIPSRSNPDLETKLYLPILV